jgi:hypothetical protein
MKRSIRRNRRISKKNNRSRRKRISRRSSRRNRRTSRRRTRKYRRSSRKNKRKYRSRRRKSMKGGVLPLIPAAVVAGGLAIGKTGVDAHYKIKSLKQAVEDLKQRETALQQKVEQQEAALLEKEKKQRDATALPEEEEVEEVEQGEGTPIFGFNQILDELEKISEDNNYTSPLIYGIFQEFCDNEAKQVQYTELNKGLPKQFNFDDDLPPFLSDAIKSNLQRRYEVNDDDIEIFFAEFMKLFNERRGSRLYKIIMSHPRERKASPLEILLNAKKVEYTKPPHDMTVKDEPSPVHIPADEDQLHGLMSI